VKLARSSPRERLGRQCKAANLISERILAYVIVEMVEPNLAYNRETDPHALLSTAEVAARLGAHMIDFVDYRGDLTRVARVIRH